MVSISPGSVMEAAEKHEKAISNGASTLMGVGWKEICKPQSHIQIGRGGEQASLTMYYRWPEKKTETHLGGARPVYCTAARVDAAAMEMTPSTTTVRPPFVPAGPEDQISESERTGCS
jgi:hypothetical protein